MMNTQIQGILGLLRQSDPVIVSHHWQQRLGGKQIASLWKPHPPLQRVPCPTCHYCHRVQVRPKEQRYFFTCDTAQTTYFIQASCLQRWQLSVPIVLKHLACELGIRPQVTHLYTSHVWQLGTATIPGSNMDVEVWLCRRVSPAVLVWLLKQEIPGHTTLLTLGPKPLLHQLSLPLIAFDLLLLVRDADPLCLDRQTFQRWLISAFQRVRFESTNGDLWVDDKRICTATPASAPFFFVQCLWEQFDQPVSHEDIFAYCRRQLAQRDSVAEWQSEYLPATFCHTMKRLLKKQAYAQALCDEIIQVTRTHDEQNAYRLTTPNYSPVRSAGMVKNATNSAN